MWRPPEGAQSPETSSFQWWCFEGWLQKLVAVVEWNSETGFFMSVEVGNRDNHSHHLFGIQLMEVIGNIYENPKLSKVS